jgi:hypothetical protein
MRKNLNVNKVVNEMDNLLLIIYKQEWEKNKDYYLKVLNERGKTYLIYYFELENRRYSLWYWRRKNVVSYIERRDDEGVNKVKLVKKINNEVLHFKKTDSDNYRVIVELELFKSICEVERI